MKDFDLSYVFEVSVSEPQAGVGEFNTSNVAVFTHEKHDNSFGNLGYKIFVSPDTIDDFFGSASVTSKLVRGIFGQKPNIRANGGYCVVIPMLTYKAEITYDIVPDAGGYDLTINGSTVAVVFDDTKETLQTKIRSISPIFSHVKVSDIAGGFHIDYIGFYTPVVTTTSNNTLVNNTDPVTITIDNISGETAAEALTRAKNLVQFFGFMFTTKMNEADVLALGLVNASLRKIGFVGFDQIADLADEGPIDKVRLSKYTNLRCLYHGQDPLLYCATFAGRGLSVNFSGSNTTITMHLKDQVGLLPDTSLDDTSLLQAKKVGAEVYISFRGVPKTFTSGANEFFDNVYNLLWYVEALQVAEFNAFATVGTKIPQTENGQDVLVKVCRSICEQARTNGFVGAGEWTRPDTFGNQADFLENIRQFGYFIFANPLAKQSVVDREDRKAPLIQIAIKYQGAFHSGTAIVNVNK